MLRSFLRPTKEDGASLFVIILAGLLWRQHEPLLSSQHAEALACLKGLEQATTMGMENVILETDVTIVANGIGGIT